jgi:hypothetical protein
MACGAGLCKRDGDFRAYHKKGKWGTAAKANGLSKADGDQLNNEAERHYTACAEAWRAMREAAATAALSGLVSEVRSLIDRFQAEKRRIARLDFDDLIFAARDLLRDHEAVRQALGRRYAHLLVDEFQDTDPLQAEIFWRLCGDPVTEESAADWQSFRIRPTATQQLLLDESETRGPNGLKEQYLLRYMLDVETHGSPSLLNVRAFNDPGAYKLKVKLPGSDESREVNVPQIISQAALICFILSSRSWRSSKLFA